LLDNTKDNMPINSECLAVKIAALVFRINSGKGSAGLEPILPEVCAGCSGSDPAVNEAMVDAEVAADGLLKVAVNTVTGNCPQATG
jgi:hypothetical protein